MHQGAANISAKTRTSGITRALLLGTILSTTLFFNGTPSQSVGLITSHPFHTMRGHFDQLHAHSQVNHSSEAVRSGTSGHRHSSRNLSQLPEHGKKNGRKGQSKKSAVPEKTVVYSPQNYVDQLNLRSLNVTDGVVYKSIKSPLTINVLDIDLINSKTKFRPILAGESFHDLKDVSDDVKESHAIAAVNANYFKRDGIPLGTLIVDGEWVAGPLYERVSLGIKRDGSALVERVKLGGVLETSNADLPSVWINNINQPRRTGSRLVAYTRRWGNFVRLPYEGCLIALDARGRIVDKSVKEMTIPWGGMVLTDSKDGKLSKLNVGDETHLSWQSQPNDWHDVVQAVSGGPLLIKDGNLFLDLKDEQFRSAWSGAQIKARTAAAVTAKGHLLLVTVEGAHTLWDLAKFLQKMGAVDALNLDGGGSTTMVVNGLTVTRAPKSSQRRVATAIGIFEEPKLTPRSSPIATQVQLNFTDFAEPELSPLADEAVHVVSGNLVAKPDALPLHLSQLNISHVELSQAPESNAVATDDNALPPPGEALETLSTKLSH